MSLRSKCNISCFEHIFFVTIHCLCSICFMFSEISPNWWRVNFQNWDQASWGRCSETEMVLCLLFSSTIALPLVSSSPLTRPSQDQEFQSRDFWSRDFRCSFGIFIFASFACKIKPFSSIQYVSRKWAEFNFQENTTCNLQWWAVYYIHLNECEWHQLLNYLCRAGNVPFSFRLVIIWWIIWFCTTHSDWKSVSFKTNLGTWFAKAATSRFFIRIQLHLILSVMMTKTWENHLKWPIFP